jgi:2-polyprenyl-3-methyl-5-hydroxy-6-metoxy-1,4-benzoquinol methylase
VAAESEGCQVDIMGKNKEHYDTLYARVDARKLINRIRDLDHFLTDAIATDTSWHGMYHGGLREKLSGLRVLELGAGDGLNALVMAALGADVVAVDISEFTPAIVQKAASELGLSSRVVAYAGDFLAMSDFPPCSFDLVVGKGFLHHLDHATESLFLHKSAGLLKPKGEARYVEPATNSAMLDALRYLTPVPGRPSSLNKKAFQAWRDADPHPVRDNSSAHYRRAVSQEFGSVEIFCIGCIERFERFLPQGKLCRSYRRLAFRVESVLPKRCNELFARTQLIVCNEPHSARKGIQIGA